MADDLAPCAGGEEVAVDWVSGLVLHSGDVDWHPWDDALYGPKEDPRG